jgi:large subunit ribosomal protein L22
MTEKRYGIKDNEARAFLRMVRVSPQKLNLVAASIRGLPVGKAVEQLAFSKKRVAGDARKLLLSAAANAQNNYGLDVDRLFVKEAYVGKALVMKRFHARARGRGAPILKPFSNMTVVVAERAAAPAKEHAPKKEASKSAPAKEAKKPAEKKAAKKEAN